MTIKDCIDLVENQKPNQYTIKEKVMWLSFIDEIIINEVLKTHEGYDGRYDDFKGYTEDKLSVVLIVPSPYDRLYPAYLKMKIDGENGETARYNSSSALYNSYMLEFRKHYNKTHMPLTSGAKKPIKYPTTTNAGLSDAELDNLKKELTFILTEYFSNTISDDKVYNVVNNFVQNNIQMLKGKDGKPGKDGRDATTPILGVDYFTKADKEQIVSEVAKVVKVPKKISELIDDTSVGITSINYAKQAMVADSAYTDGYNNIIKDTYATKEEFGTVEAIAKGRATGYVFDTIEDMNIWLTSDQKEAPYPNTDLLKLGDNLYIRETDVPDYWWDGSAAQPLETQKVDLTEYVKNTDYATADKAGIAKIARNSVYGVYADEKNLLRTYPASPTDIRNKTNNTRPITVNNLEYAVEVCTNQDINAELTEAQLKLPPSTQSVKDSIGDIDKALERIIAIQNELMGVLLNEYCR